MTRISPEPNPDAAYRTAFLDDGQEDPDGGADQGGFRGPDPSTLWPWTTFDVNGWFTDDLGPQFTIWTAGLDLDVGDRMLIAGEAFTTSIPEEVEHSGMAVVCASTEYTPDLDATWREWFGGAVVPGGNEPEGEADPAAVAEIEAGRARWQEVEPAAYSAMLSITFDEPIEGPCPTDRPLLIVVIDGIVTSAINSALGCRLDPDAQQLPTVDDLFDQAIAAQAAAGDHAYQIDSVWGFPSFHGYDRSIELSGGVSWFYPAATTTLVDDEIPAGLASQRARWGQVAPPSYTFALERLCFCEDVGPFTVTVADGETDSITTSDGTPISADPAAGLPGSIEDLFNLLDGATDQHDLVVATFDADSGLPVNIYIDSVTNGVDDEVAYLVHDLEMS